MAELDAAYAGHAAKERIRGFLATRQSVVDGMDGGGPPPR